MAGLGGAWRNEGAPEGGWTRRAEGAVRIMHLARAWIR